MDARKFFAVMLLAAFAPLVTGAADAQFEDIWSRASKDIDGGVAVIALSGTWQRSDHKKSARIPIASITKLMTAQVAMQLISEKRLSLEMPLRDLLGWMPTWTHDVTIEQLLTHTSGLQNMNACLGEDAKGTALINLTKSKQFLPLRDRITKCAGTALVNPPGSKFDYNNLDFLVLQAVVESIERRDFQSVLGKRVFKPAGMKHSNLAPFGNIPESVLKSYHLVEGRVAPELRFNIGVYGGAGSVVSTLDDVVRWVRWSMNQPAAVSPLSAGSRYGQFQGYGTYAFSTDVFGTTPTAVIERPGATAYYQWQVSVVPDKKIAVVAYALNDGAQLGNLFQKSGLAVDLLKAAIIN
jgi:CubicO group peptidase (beta-lactamase class C family)